MRLKEGVLATQKGACEAEAMGSPTPYKKYSCNIYKMKRPVRSEDDGLYHIKGKTYKYVRGSRAQVWNHTAYKTEGGLHRNELIKSHGRIVSLKKHKTAKKEMRLQKYGYFAQKGKFGYVKKSTRKNRRSGKKGGALLPLSPADVSVANVGTNAATLSEPQV
jgi:hypothetical protein